MVKQSFHIMKALGFYIDLDNGKLIIDQDGNEYYTYPMYRESEEKLENIIFKLINQDEIKAYIAKYDVTPQEFDALSIEDKKNLEPIFQKAIEFGPYVCIDIMQTVVVGHDCPYERWSQS